MKYTLAASVIGSLAIASNAKFVPEEHKMAFRQLLETSTLQSGSVEACGAEMTIKVNNQHKPFQLYIDGELVGARTGGRSATFKHTVVGDEDLVVGISSIYEDDFLENKGVELEISLCNERVISNYEWLCSDLKPSGNTWSTSLFNTDTWRQARILSTSEISDDINGIWAKPCGADIPKESFCRTTIQNTCTNPCVRAEILETTETPVPDLTCLEKCNEEMTDIKDYCDRYNHIFTSKCHTCLDDTETWVKNDCRKNGCDYEDCHLEKPLGSFDMSCFDDCMDGMNDAADTCSAQKYMLTSDTCGKQCSEGIRQFARNSCQRKGCSREDCDLPTFPPTEAPTIAPTIKEEEEVAQIEATPAPTPDVTCFAGCLFGANRIENECEKVDYTLNSGCSRCPPETMEWARGACLDLGCTSSQCNGV